MSAVSKTNILRTGQVFRPFLLSKCECFIEFNYLSKWEILFATVRDLKSKSGMKYVTGNLESKMRKPCGKIIKKLVRILREAFLEYCLLLSVL